MSNYYIFKKNFNQNRCPKETVTFFQAQDAKNTIRFSFGMTSIVDLLNITKAYIHCFPGTFFSVLLNWIKKISLFTI